MSSHFLSNSFVFDHVYVESVGTTAGLLEYQGPLGSYFDKYYLDHYHGNDSYELAEIEMLSDAIFCCLNKAKIKKEDVDIYFGGDLNNQLTACYYHAFYLKKPFIGLYQESNPEWFHDHSLSISLCPSDQNIRSIKVDTVLESCQDLLKMITQ